MCIYNIIYYIYTIYPRGSQRRGSQRRPSRRARRRGSASPCPSSFASASGRHAEPAHHRRSGGGHRVGGGDPTSWGWGASAAIFPEGEPGATQAGGHLPTSRQVGGSRSPGWADAHGSTSLTKPGLAGRLHRPPWTTVGGAVGGGEGKWTTLPSPPRFGQRGQPSAADSVSPRPSYARRVTISAAPGSWSVEVGIVKDLPVRVLLGRDWPGFDRLLAATTQPVSPTGNRRRQKLNRGPRWRPILLASDSARDGESPSQTTNLFYDVFQQVTGGGAFAKEQLGDDRLKHCWTQVRVIEGKETQPPPHPVPHFVVQNGLLYWVAQRRGEEKKLLVVPRSKTETVMELAHSHPMAGHLGAQNTIQRIRDRFHWPGLDAEVKRFCQACPTCQQTSPRTPPPSPLIPLPILEVPFERIGMDLVGPLPKSARGHKHILVIVDYATRYPEAIPLRKATSKAIAQELFLLCSRVGIQILTDQGTPFMSRMMADLCRFLKVKQLRTTVYHPQTDGLVERFKRFRRWSRCSVGWLLTTSGTGIRCCRTFSLASGKSPRLLLVSPPLSSCLGVSLAACSTSQRKPGNSSRQPIGQPSNTSVRWGSGLTGSCR